MNRNFKKFEIFLNSTKNNDDYLIIFFLKKMNITEYNCVHAVRPMNSRGKKIHIKQRFKV